MIPLAKRTPSLHNALPSATTTMLPVAMTTTQALEITMQPPEIWYKDQFGRKATFEVHVRRTIQACARCAEQRHLTVHLLYENGKMVENQSILRVTSGLCLNKDNESVIGIRIMEVSKNHQNQRYRIQISLAQCPDKCALLKPATTDAVLVLSKKNKRPVKFDPEQPIDKSPKLKKSKYNDAFIPVTPVKLRNFASDYTSPSPNRSADNISSKMDDFADSMAEESNWATQIVRFKVPSESVCLWANAAYDFLHKLQFQRTSNDGPDVDIDKLRTQSTCKPYQCLVCQESYGSVPSHSLDCDLNLLLQQSNQFDQPVKTAEETPRKIKEQGGKDQEKDAIARLFPSPFMSTTKFFKPESSPAKFPTKYNITQDLLQYSDEDDSSVAPAAPAFDSTSVDMLAKNLTLNTWEGYSTLSKFMISMEMDGKSFPAGPSAAMANSGRGPRVFLDTGSRQNVLPAILPTLGNASAILPEFEDSNLNKGVSTSFSKLISSVKDMPADAAALLQEQDTELNGDTSLLSTLSRVSLSDIMNSESTTLQNGQSNGIPESASAPSFASNVSQPSEDAVAAIVAVDFRHCGYPAFDQSFTLLGFYFLSGSKEKSTCELRYLPNLYPLPPEMLAELDQSVVGWKLDTSVLFYRQEMTKKTLSDLKCRAIKYLTAK